MNLTDEQLAIVETRVLGLLQVEAGPGSGKTRVIVERALHRLRKGTPAEHLLILTFTRAAAAEIKSRILETLREGGARWPRLPEVDTIHGWAASYLRRIANASAMVSGDIGVDSGFAVYDEVDREAAYRVTAAEVGNRRWDSLRVDTMRRMPEIETAYQRKMRAANALDFDHLVPLAEKALAGRAAPLAYVEVLVDEAQDVTIEEWRLIQAIRAGSPKHQLTMIVGDPWQLVYEWRGVDPALWGANGADADGVHHASLTENFRCDKAIRAFADSLTRGERATGGRDDMGIVAQSTVEDLRSLALDMFHVRDAMHGPRWIGTRPATCAVLARTWRDVEQAADVFEAVGEAVRVQRKATGPWQGDHGRLVATLLKVILNPHDDAMVGILAYRLNDQDLALRARQVAARDRVQLLEALAAVSTRWGIIRKALMIEDGVPGTERTESRRESLDHPLPVISLVLGFVTPRVEETLAELGLSRTTGTWSTTAQALVDWLNFDGQQLAERGATAGAIPPITFTTFHGAKGLEWDFVIVVERGNDADEPHGEERRLRYVAATRARHFLSMVRLEDGRSPW